MIPGDAVVVVGRTDDTLPPEFLGRLGIVERVLPYMGVGDSPPEDPMFLVRHWPAPSRADDRDYVYWREEIA